MVQFTLRTYEESLYNREFLDKNQMDNRIWLHIPSNISKYLTLTKVIDGETLEDIDIENKYTRDDNRPLMCFDAGVLSSEIGNHVYQFVFEDNDIQELTILYLSYQVYDNKVEKPYVYMNR